MKLFIFLLILFFCSCSQKQVQKVDILQMDGVELKSHRVNKEEVIARGGFPFVMIDSLFFLFNGEPSTGAIVLRESDASVCGNFFRKGNGFGECNSPNYAGRNKDTIYVYERSSPRRMSYLLFYKDGVPQYQCIEDVRSKKNMEFYTTVCRLENGLYVGARMFGERHLFTLLDEKMDSLTTFGKIPLAIDSVGNQNFVPFFGDLTVDGNTVYYASERLSYMAAYEVVSPTNIVPKFERMYVDPVYKYFSQKISFDQQKHLDGFNTVRIHGDNVFATYSGRPNSAKETEGIAALVPTQLLMFDKSGNPLTKFVLPFKIREIAFSDLNMYFLDLDCNIEMVELNQIYSDKGM